MPLSYVQSVGDGTTRNFDLTFDYLSKSHVSVKVDGVDVPFTWTGVYSIQTNSAPGGGTIVERRRTTPREERLVTFTDGSTLVATDMNTSTLQAFFLAQEAFDQGAASLAVTEDGQYSAQTRRVSNVGNPVLPQDAVTKGWAETGMTSQLAIATAAKDVAVAAKVAAEGSASAASSDRQAAQTARTGSEAARDSSSGHRLNAQNAETGAKDARDAAIAARDATITARDIAVTAKDTATAKAAEAAGYAQSLNPAAILKIASNLSDVADPVAARSNLKIWTGTQAAFNALTKDAWTLYFVTA